MKYKFLLLVPFCSFAFAVAAQKKLTAKFGKVSPADFRNTAYSIDNNANAVIIADAGSTEMSGNTKNGISLEFKNYRRAHILNKNGYDIANVTIGLYAVGDDREQLLDLKAVTYNLVDGKVVQTELDPASVYTETLTKNWVAKKFTFPAIREGAIIEYEYKLKSDFIFNLQPWTFQGEYPRLWSEYSVEVPEFFRYVILSQGYLPYHIEDKKTSSRSFVFSNERPAYRYNSSLEYERGSIVSQVTTYHWVMKDVPAFKEESYTSAASNHTSRLEFQLASQERPFTPRSFMGTWHDACEELLQADNFGAALDKDNNWLNNLLGLAGAGAGNAQDKAKNIFVYVRDNITSTVLNGIYTRKSLRTVAEEKKGSVAEVNLLLVALLRKAGVLADPVILSTRSHGYTYPEYPLIDKFNYVIVRAVVNDKTYYLDASRPGLGFGRLSYECYNGHARVVNGACSSIELKADSLKEASMTSVNITGGEDGSLMCDVKRYSGYYESNTIRKKISEKGVQAYFTGLLQTGNSDIRLGDYAVDSLMNYEDPVALRYKFTIPAGGENVIYFNPLLGNGWKENPFKAAQRSYPVEMPYCIDETYIAQITVPEGYIIDELPKQAVVKLSEYNDGMFEYRMVASGATISMRTRILVNRTVFLPEEYETLREFFNLIIKKHSEAIVFKKK